MASTPAQFVGKMSAAQSAYRAVPKAIVSQGAVAMKASTLASMRRVVPSGRLRNVGRGATLSVQVVLAGDAAVVKAKGPWQLIERDTKAHQIGPKLTKAAREYVASGRGRRKAVLTPAGPRAHVRHPGTQGRHPWRVGVEAGKVGVKQAAQREAFAPIRALF